MRRRLFLQCSLATPFASAAPSRAWIGGTFLQLMPWHRQWPVARWRELFGYYQALGIREVVIQWTMLGADALYPSPVDTILAIAKEMNIEVDLGLRGDPKYWTAIQSPGKSVATYLRRLWEQSIHVAGELRHKPFRGWYICEEIDDVNWRDPDARAALIAYLAGLSQSLDRLTPRRQIAISGFAQGLTDPEGFQFFWAEIFRRTRIQTLLLQDGVGVGKLRLSELPQYYQAATQAARLTGRHVRPVVELFQQVSAVPFKGAPADIARIERQLEIARGYGAPIAFSVMEYMTPIGVEGAASLYNAWLKVHPQA